MENFTAINSMYLCIGKKNGATFFSDIQSILVSYGNGVKERIWLGCMSIFHSFCFAFEFFHIESIDIQVL